MVCSCLMYSVILDGSRTLYQQCLQLNSQAGDVLLPWTLSPLFILRNTKYVTSEL